MAREAKKKSEDEIKVIDNFKKYVEQYAAKTNFVNSVSFYEQTYKSNFRIVSTLDCGSFQQRIIYYSVFTFEEDFIDVEFAFENSEYSHSFYDIFNLFDIEDFNLYYYSNAEFDEDIENAVKNIFDATENYLYYLEKAGTPDYLPELIKNYEMDMDAACGGDYWREEETDIDDVFFARENHIIMSIADGPMNEKAIKRLKKVGAKGNLDIIYEKRLLKYIEAGNRVDRKNIIDQEEFEKTYARKLRKINLIIFAALLVFTIGLSAVINAYIFKGADFYYETFHIFGMSVGKLVLCFISSLAAIVFVHMTFGKKLIVKHMPDDMKKQSEALFTKDIKEEFGKFYKPLQVLCAIGVFILSIILFIASLCGIGYYDGYVKYSDNIMFGVFDVPYEDLEIYQIKGYYDEDDKYVLYENAYAISYGKDNYYEYGEIEDLGKIEKHLLDIADTYDKEIIELETIDELYSSDVE